MLVLLDSKPLGMVTAPKASEEAEECNKWLDGLLERNVRVRVPEIIDYEIRRKYIHRKNEKAIVLLDYLGSRIGYLKVDTETFLKAAALWGKLRQTGQGDAQPDRLDVDCLLAAQAIQAADEGEEVRIATVDSDLLRYDTETVKAMFWKDIKPPSE